MKDGGPRQAKRRGGKGRPGTHRDVWRSSWLEWGHWAGECAPLRLPPRTGQGAKGPHTAAGSHQKPPTQTGEMREAGPGRAGRRREEESTLLLGDLGRADLIREMNVSFKISENVSVSICQPSPHLISVHSIHYTPGPYHSPGYLSIPCFLKVLFPPLHLYERPTLVLCSLTKEI